MDLNLLKKNNKHVRSKNSHIHDIKKVSKNKPLSLRKDAFTIEFSKKAFKETSLKYKVVFLTGFLLLLISAGLLVYKRIGYADTTVLYPQTCLGGWTNAQNAAGKPDNDVTVDDDAFTKQNSAVLSPDSASEIYCGTFSGVTTSDTVPAHIILTLSGTAKNANAVQDQTVPIISTSDISSTTSQILNTPVDNTTTVIISDVPAATTTPPSTASSTPSSIQSFLSPLISVAYADEVQQPTSTPDIISASPSLATTTLPNATTSADTLLQTSFHATTTPDTGSTTSILATSTASTSLASVGESISGMSATSTASSTPVQEDVVEVLYTFDSVTWHSLGKISAAEMKTKQFELPVDEISSWEDLSSLQIKIQRVQSIDVSPALYLDGMQLTVAYEKILPHPNLPLTITTIKNKNRQVLRIKPIDPDGLEDKLYVSTSKNALGGLALYNEDTKALLLTTNVTDTPAYTISSTYLGAGNFLLIKTTDPNMCSGETLEACRTSVYAESESELTIEATQISSSTPLLVQ